MNFCESCCASAIAAARASTGCSAGGPSEKPEPAAGASEKRLRRFGGSSPALLSRSRDRERSRSRLRLRRSSSRRKSPRSDMAESCARQQPPSAGSCSVGATSRSIARCVRAMAVKTGHPSLDCCLRTAPDGLLRAIDRVGPVHGADGVLAPSWRPNEAVQHRRRDRRSRRRPQCRSTKHVVTAAVLVAGCCCRSSCSLPGISHHSLSRAQQRIHRAAASGIRPSVTITVRSGRAVIMLCVCTPSESSRRCGPMSKPGLHDRPAWT